MGEYSERENQSETFEAQSVAGKETSLETIARC